MSPSTITPAALFSNSQSQTYKDSNLFLIANLRLYTSFLLAIQQHYHDGKYPLSINTSNNIQSFLTHPTFGTLVSLMRELTNVLTEECNPHIPANIVSFLKNKKKKLSQKIDLTNIQSNLTSLKKAWEKNFHSAKILSAAKLSVSEILQDIITYRNIDAHEGANNEVTEQIDKSYHAFIHYFLGQWQIFDGLEILLMPAIDQRNCYTDRHDIYIHIGLASCHDQEITQRNDLFCVFPYIHQENRRILMIRGATFDAKRADQVRSIEYTSFTESSSSLDPLITQFITDELHKLPTFYGKYPLSPAKQKFDYLPNASLTQFLRPEYTLIPWHQTDNHLDPQALAKKYTHFDPQDPQLKTIVHLIHGEGGIGKTRFASELMSHIKDSSWITGFWQPNDQQATLKDIEDHCVCFFKSIIKQQRSVFLCIDYAETRLDVVDIILRVFNRIRSDTQKTRNTTGNVLLRILLLTRSVSNDYERNLRDALLAHQAFLETTHLQASSLQNQASALDLYQKARTAFAHIITPDQSFVVDPPTIMLPTSPLTLATQALLDVVGARYKNIGQNQEERFLLELLKREKASLDRALQAQQITELLQTVGIARSKCLQVLMETTAFIAMQGRIPITVGDYSPQLINLVEETLQCSLLRGVPRNASINVLIKELVSLLQNRFWHRDFLAQEPAQGNEDEHPYDLDADLLVENYVAFIPDRFGEIVIRDYVTGAHKDIVERILREHFSQALPVLVRTMNRYGKKPIQNYVIYQLIKNFLKDYFWDVDLSVITSIIASQAQALVDTSSNNDNYLLSILNNTTKNHNDTIQNWPAYAWKKLDALQIPLTSLTLASFIIWRLTSLLRDPAITIDQQIERHQQLGKALQIQGNMTAALTEAQKAATLWLHHYTIPTENSRHSLENAPLYATILSDLGNGYYSLSQLSQAINCAEQAKSIRETILIHDPHRIEVLEDLAKSSTNLGVFYRNYKQYHLAEDVLKKAITIRQSLLKNTAIPQSKRKEIMSLLAGAYNNLSNLYSVLSQHHDSLQAISQAAGCIYPLFQEDTDRYLGDYLRYLNNQSVSQIALTQYEDAAKTGFEVIETLKRVIESHVSSDTLQNDLAIAYNNLAKTRSLQNMWHESLQYLDSAIEIYRKLHKKSPEQYKKFLEQTEDNKKILLSIINKIN